MQVTYDCWQEAIKICKPGVRYSEIGGVIEDYVTERGFDTSRQFIGHGIGRAFHTIPNVFHHHNNQNEGVMKPGHTFTIEPMIAEGSCKGGLWPDGWTATTDDGSRSAQFEHTFLITEDGIEALTAKLPTSPVQPWEKPLAEAKEAEV